MPTTPLHALRYPSASDSADVPRDIGNLAADVDAALPPVAAASPPATPVDGQRWLYVADAANGVEWEFVYRAAASTFKWEFIGGGWLAAEVLTDQAVPAAQTSYAALTTPTTVGIPRAGWYDVAFGATMYGGGAGQLFTTIGGATAPADADAAVAATTAGGVVVTTSRIVRRQFTVAALYLFHRNSVAQNTNAYNRWLRIQPVRVS